MSLTLSSDDVSRLDAAVYALVTPFAFPDISSWSAEAMRRCSAFLGADQAMFGMMSQDRMVVEGFGEHTPDAAHSYQSYYWRKDFVVTERRLQLGLEVYHRDMLYRPGEIRRDEVYNDWSVPNKLCDTIGMSVEGPGDPLLAGVHFYHNTESGTFRDAGQPLLRLLLPAFRAGIQAWLALGERRRAIQVALDSAGDGVMLTDLAGRTIDETASLAATLGGEPGQATIRAALGEAAATLGALVLRREATRAQSPGRQDRIVQTVRTAQARYRIVATHLPSGTVGPQGAVAVVLARTTRRPVSTEQLQARFGLTAREIDVVRLLIAGRRNDEIARVLGISVHTAERHTENVLRKVGVRSRAAVTSALFDGAE